MWFITVGMWVCRSVKPPPHHNEGLWVCGWVAEGIVYGVVHSWKLITLQETKKEPGRWRSGAYSGRLAVFPCSLSMKLSHKVFLSCFLLNLQRLIITLFTVYILTFLFSFTSIITVILVVTCLHLLWLPCCIFVALSRVLPVNTHFTVFNLHKRRCLSYLWFVNCDINLEEMFSDLHVFTQTQFYTFLYVIPKNKHTSLRQISY